MARHSERVTDSRRIVFGYTALLLLIGGSLTAVAVTLDNSLERSSLQLPWWLLAVLFAGAQTFVVHVQSRRETRSVGLAEVPFVVGLVLAHPLSFAVGRIAGCICERALLSRQWRQPTKLVFNTSVVAAEIGLGLVVFHALADSHARDPATWLGAGVAAIVASTLSGIAVSGLIARLEGDGLRVGLVVAFLRSSLLQTIGIAAVGVVASAALVTSAWTAVPLTAVGALVGVAYRAYARLAERHANVESLYRFTQSIAAYTDADAVVGAMLDQVSDMLHAEAALLTFFSGDEPVPETEALGRRGSPLLRRPATYLTRDHGWIVDRLCHEGMPLLLPRDAKDSATRHWLRSAGLREAILAPLRGDHGTVAALIVVDRLGEARGFDDGDLQLLLAAANHASVALRHGQLVDKLRHDSLHDALTGVPNRAYLQQEVSRRLESGDAELAVVMLDLDGFKDVNDTFGHNHGDAMLCEVAERLKRAVGDRAVVSRLGGDEFGLLLSDCRSDDEAERICRVMLNALLEPIDIAGTAVDVSASMGIARAPAHATTWVDLMKRADVAMYHAKQAGRDIVSYDPAHDTSSPTRLALVSALRQAISDGDLRLHVQPQVSLQTH